MLNKVSLFVIYIFNKIKSVLHLELHDFTNFPSQLETNRKILEDLQLKRQLLQKGVNNVADINSLGVGVNTNINQACIIKNI